MALLTWRALLVLALAAKSAAIRGQVPHLVGRQPTSRGEPAGYQQVGEVARLLQDMEAQITNEGAKGKASHEGFLLYCKSTSSELATRISRISTRQEETANKSVQTGRNNISDTQATLPEDVRLADGLNATCAKTTSEFETGAKIRTEELAAIAETIKMLTDHDGLKLFSTTLPSATASSDELLGSDTATARALQILRTISKKDHARFALRMDFVVLALKGETAGFNKAIKMIDGMAKTIEEEQLADEQKQDDCHKRLHSTDDKIMELASQSGNMQTAITDTEHGLEVVTEMIAKKNHSIAELDKEVADATEQRNQDHELHLKGTVKVTAARQLLVSAQSRLLQFYTAQPHTTNTTASGGTVPAHVFAHSEFSLPPPEAPAPYSKKAEESTRVMSLIDSFIKHLDMDITQANISEERDQEAYNALMTDAANHRNQDNRTLTGGEGIKKSLDAKAESQKGNQTANFTDTQAASNFLAQLHVDCQWFQRYYGVRQTARASELDALADANSVLSGADSTLSHASKDKKHHGRRPTVDASASQSGADSTMSQVSKGKKHHGRRASKDKRRHPHPHSS